LFVLRVFDPWFFLWGEALSFFSRLRKALLFWSKKAAAFFGKKGLAEVEI